MKLKAIFRMRGFIQDCYSYLVRQDRKLNAIQREIKNHVMTKLDEHDTKLGKIDGKLDQLLKQTNGNHREVPDD